MGASLKLYSYVGSQWAGVPHLGLAEKGFKPDEVEIKEIDLFQAENFDPEYLKINPNGTVPSLEYPSQDRPLIDTREILEYLDTSRSGGGISSLSPKDPKTAALVAELIALVHSDDVSTNLILLQPRDLEEYTAKKSGPFAIFVANRQAVLEKNHRTYPEDQFYSSRRAMNGSLHEYYITEPGSDGKHEAFFKATRDAYETYAKEMGRLESLLVLPYAAGKEVTTADLHIVPWVTHAQMGVGTKDIKDLDTLEKHFQKTVAGFEIGPKTREWWENITERESVKKVFQGKPH